MEKCIWDQFFQLIPILWGNLKLNEQEKYTIFNQMAIGVDHIKPFLGCVNWIEWNVNQIKMLSIVKPHFKKKKLQGILKRFERFI